MSLHRHPNLRNCSDEARDGKDNHYPGVSCCHDIHSLHEPLREDGVDGDASIVRKEAYFVVPNRLIAQDAKVSKKACVWLGENGAGFEGAIDVLVGDAVGSAH